MSLQSPQKKMRREVVADEEPAPPIRELLPGRWTNIRRRMDESGLRALVVGGHGSLHHYGYIEYVSGYCPWQQNACVVLGREGAPVLIVCNAETAKVASAICTADVRYAGAGGLAAAVIQCLEILGTGHGQVGIVDVDSISAADFSAIENKLPPNTLRDATRLLSDIKARKTKGDIAHLMRVSALADQGMAAFAGALRPGAQTRDLCAKVERALHAGGAREVIVRLGSGPDFSLPSPARRIEAGQLLCAYVEVLGDNGYWVELIRTVAIGTLPAKSVRLLDACIDVFNSVERAIGFGCRASEIAVLADEAVRRTEFRLDGQCGHGVGIDDRDAPRIMLEDATPLEPGMVIAIHPRLVDDKTHMAAVIGDTFVVAPEGPYRLSRYEQKVLWVET